MLRIGICDDEQGARFTLRSGVQRLLDRRDISCTVFEFSSAEGLLGWLPRHPGELDLVFLDIEMGGMNGMEAAREIRKSDDALALVFVTGYADYVFDGYSVGALGYLTKPPDHRRLEDVLERVLAGLHKREPRTYTLRNADGLYRVPVEQILYFMSDRRQVILVTGAKSYTFYGKLDEVEGQVEDFVRIHRRFLVNLAAIEGLEGDEAVVGPERLPVSRSQRPSLVEAMGRAMTGGGDA